MTATSWEVQLGRLRNCIGYRGLVVEGHISEQPITRRQRFYDSPQDFVIDRDDLWDVNFTSGSTKSFSTPVYTTCYDKLRMVPAYREFGQALGLSPDDVFFMLTPVGARPHVAETRTVLVSETSGCPTVVGHLGPYLRSLGVDNTQDAVLRRARVAQCTVLCGFPSILRRFLELTREKGINLPLRYVLSAGDSLSSQERYYLTELASSVSNNPCSVRQMFMSTEMQIPFYECTPGGGLHCSDPSYLYTEVVNNNGDAVKSGESGQLLITHLDRTGTALLRYETGDYCVLADGTCEVCGKPLSLLPFADGSYVRRAPDRVKVKGQLVSLVFLEQKLGDVLSSRVRVDVRGNQELIVRMPANLGQYAEDVRRWVKSWVDVTPVVMMDEQKGLKGVGL